ncbi:DNA glycosylase AlkZ-like family protein [Aureibacillus halotolerans]|uniref:Uncharacterized protein YcaQ n=1 Tax=Aureibacillus halotolerans TaxID=1508390 RepID=A0A4V3D5R5_9BACI|nr:crosslink repair DNA glycosylase YcaQ family protein [Aureibacillus halotolerans]TDQ41167.1 uncharacterized protein YcaQ [Aureibacillus halotolerans]
MALDVEQIKRRFFQYNLRPFQQIEKTIQQMGAVQIDPVNIVAPNHHLVLNNRLANYSANQLTEAIQKGKIVETYAKERCFIHVEDLPLYWPYMMTRKEKLAPSLVEYKEAMDVVLDHFHHCDTDVCTNDIVHEQTTNVDVWGPRRVKTQLLELMWRSGMIVVTRREGNKKWYRLIEDALPEELVANLPKSLEAPHAEALGRKHVESLGLCRANYEFIGFQRRKQLEKRRIKDSLITEEPLQLITIGKEDYFISEDFARFATQSDDAVATTEPMLLSPLDNTIWDRTLLKQLYDFDYIWEIYKPAEKRKLGPYSFVLIDNGDILGQADIKHEKQNCRLIVNAFEKTIPSETVFLEKLHMAMERLKQYTKAETVVFP